MWCFGTLERFLLTRLPFLSEPMFQHKRFYTITPIAFRYLNITNAAFLFNAIDSPKPHVMLTFPFLKGITICELNLSGIKTKLEHKQHVKYYNCLLVCFTDSRNISLGFRKQLPYFGWNFLIKIAISINNASRVDKLINSTKSIRMHINVWYTTLFIGA